MYEIRGFAGSWKKGLIVVEEFFHVGPPLARFARFEWFLAWLAYGPPFLRARVGGDQCHVGIEVISHILEVGKQNAVLVIDRVVANSALGDLCENLEPNGARSNMGRRSRVRPLSIRSVPRRRGGGMRLACAGGSPKPSRHQSVAFPKHPRDILSITVRHHQQMIVGGNHARMRIGGCA